MFSLRRYSAPLALLVIVAGCSSEPTKEATTESAQPASKQAGSETAPRARASSSMQDFKPKTIPGDRSVYYDFDKSEIGAQARGVIEAHAQYLREHPDAKIRIEGNADERGSAEYNLALGQRRAEGVTKMMRLLGVSETRVEAVSLGKEKPKKSGHDETSWAENRRSDIVY